MDYDEMTTVRRVYAEMHGASRSHKGKQDEADEMDLYLAKKEREKYENKSG